MTVLVTGGAGYIGSHTVVELLSAGHETIIVDDLSNAKGDVIDRIETITGKRPEFYQFKVTRWSFRLFLVHSTVCGEVRYWV